MLCRHCYAYPSTWFISKHLPSFLEYHLFRVFQGIPLSEWKESQKTEQKIKKQFCTPTWQSYHVTENQEYRKLRIKCVERAATLTWFPTLPDWPGCPRIPGGPWSNNINTVKTLLSRHLLFDRWFSNSHKSLPLFLIWSLFIGQLY